MPRSQLRNLLIGELSWKRLVRSLLFIYGFFAFYVFLRADSMIFLPQPATYQDNTSILKVPVTDKQKISAVYLPNPRAEYTILYIHGNAEDIGDVQPLLERLHQWGFSVFAYDYRGFGTSDGKPGESNAYQDAEAAYIYLTQQLKVPGKKIIVYGRSVGGGSAVDLATRHSVAGLILESTFTSAFRVVVPFPLLPFDKFSNLKKLPQVNCPVLVMHGQADQTIPVQHGYTLYSAAPNPKMSLWVDGAGHDDFTWVANEQHQKTLVAFQQLIENRNVNVH
ncbi:alpha/beta fold hydrolase [Nostoc spongiaeforme FACHB-130]|uniref:Alpha/beta fold hydrolase n=1 Tax=Nostoc spongiaeforme FACHB-130 TaxID=1357510 RepID=A0ABR8FZX7_9NOSO|nr:alpha/beta hydrolase [Nostoc spongiaeforme]MBD2596516.1 alpha/beta fold hydrolase [Nostoc spongiaeforme FACHB-130]